MQVNIWYIYVSGELDEQYASIATYLFRVFKIWIYGQSNFFTDLSVHCSLHTMTSNPTSYFFL